ncbi:hypothetical protein L249_3401 [Ophiocordyceps polyrhachis-furcata BCC 54312]|uniref:Uncharacterized protein n=1 Tax=Ophiocordyceps polyrhachis-furcata BCC 54312 TaxID=1330021 RepID=A0A367LM26_9HYPO|nr:hypothetical protein L249_3401 [Ophiocordyceps polyrhachis-furcata BCC 54312]
MAGYMTGKDSLSAWVGMEGVAFNFAIEPAGWRTIVNRRQFVFKVPPRKMTMICHLPASLVSSKKKRITTATVSMNCLGLYRSGDIGHCQLVSFGNCKYPLFL